MQIRFPRITFSITPAACIGFALALLLIPLPWIIAWFAASLVHELGHFLAVCLCGGNVYEIRVDNCGIKMRIPQLSAKSEALCAAAGPTAGALLLLFARWMPRLALCGVFQSLYNLIPLFPMDGGRILLGLLRSAFPNTADKIYVYISFAALLLLFLLSVYAAFLLKLGAVPLILYGMLLFQIHKVKISCKPGQLRVQ